MNANAIEKARKNFEKKLPQRLTCTKCEKVRNKDQFGVRLMNRPDVEKGKANPVFARQAQCNDCRH